MEFFNVSCLSARLPVRVRVSLSLAVLRGEVCISLISLLVPCLHFAIVQESTMVLNLQIHNGRRDTHAMAQEFQQSHLCGIVELGSVWLSVSCLSVPRIKKVDCKDRAQPTPETGIKLPVGAVDQFTACTSGYSTYISGIYDEIASRARYDIFSALARYAIVHTGIVDQVERLGYISESHFPTRCTMLRCPGLDCPPSC